MSDELDNWCRAVPGLTKVEDRLWTASAVSDVSFPHEGLSILADLEERSFWFSHRNRLIETVARRYEPKGPIFDVGGGNGIVSLALSRAGFDPIVIEPDRQGTALAHRRGLSVISAAFQDLSLSPGAMAAAGLFDVLEHIEDEQGTLARLARSLRPGGRLYITVPAYNFLWAEEDIHSGHCRRYTLGRLAKLVSAHGFRIDYGSYFFAALVPAILAMRTLPWRLGRRSSLDSAKVERDHSLPPNALGRLLRRSLDAELRHVGKGGRIPFGASCLIVATRLGTPGTS